MKPNVLVVTTYYHPVVGGVEIHARQLVRYLHTHGFGVEVVTKRVHTHDAKRGLIDAVPVRRLGPTGERRASGKWVMLPALARRLFTHRHRYDVIVCVDYRGIGVAAILLGDVLGKPVIAQGEVAGVLAGPEAGSASGLPMESPVERWLKAPLSASDAISSAKPYTPVCRPIASTTFRTASISPGSGGRISVSVTSCAASSDGRSIDRLCCSSDA